MEYYPANIASTKDVDADLTVLKEEHGWEPDFIVWDYPDKMDCEDKTIKDTRIKIQHVYHDIIRLHNKWDCFGIGVSPVNKNAVGKAIIDMRDFAEDFQKAYNAHAAFALCATPEEEKAHIRRIVPVFQREGVGLSSGKACVVKLDEARMQMTELSFEEANKVIAEMEAGIAQPDSKYSKRKKPEAPEKPSIKKDVEDE